MCNFIYFSTDSEEDFEKLPRELFAVFPWQEQNEELEEVLKFPHRWYLQCRYGGCSCHFRHAQHISLDQGFRPPDYNLDPESDEAEGADIIESTQATYDLFSRIAQGGHKLDLYDSWNDEIPMKVETIDVSLADVGREAFRFLENIRVVLSP